MCSRESSDPLGFFLIRSIFPVLAREGLEGRSQEGDCLLLRVPPAADAEARSGVLCGAPCVWPCCRKSKQRRWRGRTALPPPARGMVDVEGGGRGLCKTHSGAIEPGFTHGPRSLPRAGSPLLLLPVSLRLGAAPPRAGRKRGLLCTLRAPGQQLWRGPPAHPGHRSSVAAFSSNRKTIPRTGPSSCLQTLVSPEAPRAAFVTTPA